MEIEQGVAKFTDWDLVQSYLTASHHLTCNLQEYQIRSIKSKNAQEQAYGERKWLKTLIPKLRSEILRRGIECEM